MVSAKVNPSDSRVTWLMPVLNGMPYLPQTLESIERQTHRQWELYVWDNGSTDGTVEELHRWIPARLPGRVFTGSPLNVADSLKALVEAAPTELCARIDADDLNAPDRIEKQVAFLHANPRTGLVGSWHSVIDQHGKPAGDVRRLPTNEAELLWQILFKSVFCASTVMFRRSVVLEAGNFRFPTRDVPLGEDTDLMLRVALISHVANIPEPLLAYRVRPGNTTSRLGDKANLCTIASVGGVIDRWIPGVPREAWDRLYLLLRRDYDAPVTRNDLDTLELSARLAARARGRHDTFFIETEYYRTQHSYLSARLRRSMPLLRTAYKTASHVRKILAHTFPGSESAQP